MTKTPTQPLSNVQQELLSLYATGIPDEYLLELKNVISKFLFDKATSKADEVWAEKGYTTGTITSWLNED
jgi:hypothetical protein